MNDQTKTNQTNQNMTNQSTTIYFPTEPGHAEFELTISVRQLNGIESDPRVEAREPTMAEIKVLSELLGKFSGLFFCRSTIIGG
jgi:hypothetical protein